MALLAPALLVGCGGASAPETSAGPIVEARNTAAASPLATVADSAVKWPDMVVLYGPRLFYTVDVPPAAVQIPPGWIADAPDPANASIEGPGSAVFNIRFSPLPYPGVKVDELDRQFVDSREFRDRAAPGTLESFPVIIGETAGRRMLYRARLDSGCVAAVNRVSLVTAEFLITLTGSVCLDEQELFPRQWIERMQASFTLEYT